MNELLNKIYQEVLVYEEDIVNGNRNVDRLLNDLTEPYKAKLMDDEFDKLKELLSIMASNVMLSFSFNNKQCLIKN